MLVEDNPPGGGRDLRLRAAGKNKFLPQIEPSPLLRIRLLGARGEESMRLVEIPETGRIIVGHPEADIATPVHDLDLHPGRILIPRVLENLVQDKHRIFPSEELPQPIRINLKPRFRFCHYPKLVAIRAENYAATG